MSLFCCQVRYKRPYMYMYQYCKRFILSLLYTMFSRMCHLHTEFVYSTSFCVLAYRKSEQSTLIIRRQLLLMLMREITRGRL